jgi:hypothetical protein
MVDRIKNGDIIKAAEDPDYQKLQESHQDRAEHDEWPLYFPEQLE